MNELDLFKEHKLLICVNGANLEEKRAFESIVGLKMVNGKSLSEIKNEGIHHGYLHAREKGMTYSIGPYRDYGVDMPFITLQNFIDIYGNNIQSIAEDEIECLLK